LTEQITYSELANRVFERTLNLKDEAVIKKEFKDRLKKKEVKSLLYIFSGVEKEEIMQKLNLNSERLDSILESGKKKIRGSYSKITILD
jgi:hypothetical protein